MVRRKEGKSSNLQTVAQVVPMLKAQQGTMAVSSADQGPVTVDAPLPEPPTTTETIDQVTTQEISQEKAQETAQESPCSPDTSVPEKESSIYTHVFSRLYSEDKIDSIADWIAESPGVDYPRYDQERSFDEWFTKLDGWVRCTLNGGDPNYPQLKNFLPHIFDIFLQLDDTVLQALSTVKQEWLPQQESWATTHATMHTYLMERTLLGWLATCEQSEMDRISDFNLKFNENVDRYLGHAREETCTPRAQRQICSIYLQNLSRRYSYLVRHMRYAGIDPMELCSQRTDALAVIQGYLQREVEPTRSR